MDPTDRWLATSSQIGTGGWDDFQFLFFMPDNDLYAVRQDTFLRGSYLKTFLAQQGLDHQTDQFFDGVLVFPLLFLLLLRQSIGLNGRHLFFFGVPPPLLCVL